MTRCRILRQIHPAEPRITEASLSHERFDDEVRKRQSQSNQREHGFRSRIFGFLETPLVIFRPGARNAVLIAAVPLTWEGSPVVEETAQRIAKLRQ